MNLLATLGTIDSQTWVSVGIVAGILTGIALVLVILILIVGKVFNVDVDEKVTEILENLAGANCGGCGCSGCSGFAQKLVAGSADLNECHVTSPENMARIAAILGVALKDEEPTVAIVKCMGGAQNAKDAFEYGGAQTCASCNTLHKGNKVCKYGCLGCGDCAAACPEKGVKVKNRLAAVSPEVCISCGACINACPKHIIERIPISAPVYAACSSRCKAKDVMSACKAGCIGCGLCVRSCTSGAITMSDNLPVFDYSKCTGCLACVSKCPRKIIIARM